MATIYNKKLDYFDQIDTEEKAYFLGLLYADGHNRNGRFSIGLHEQDKHILEKFSLRIFGRINLKERKPYVRQYGDIVINASRHYILNVYSVYMSKRLNELGMVPKKSLIHGFPSADQIPDRLIHHFVRGYFDGDGCLSHRTANHAKRWIVTILSSKEFCDKLIELASRELSIRVLTNKKQSAIHSISVSGNLQIKKFMDWLYSDATCFLERKYKKYLELCEDSARIKNRPSYSSNNNITFDKNRKKWMASIRYNKRTIRLGRFQSEEGALFAQQFILNELKRASNVDGDTLKSLRKSAMMAAQQACVKVLGQPLQESCPP